MTALSSRQAAHHLGIGLTTLYGLVRTGELAYLDLGGKFGFLEQDLNSYLLRRRVPSAAEMAVDAAPVRQPVVPLPDEIISVFTGRPLRVSAR